MAFTLISAVESTWVSEAGCELDQRQEGRVPGGSWGSWESCCALCCPFGLLKYLRDNEAGVEASLEIQKMLPTPLAVCDLSPCCPRAGAQPHQRRVLPGSAEDGGLCPASRTPPASCWAQQPPQAGA